ncbi:DUF2752 domain-containing protein [Sellimonas sp.]|uniref:DUF2752 domain-containing protein n=1 Tax=Sellimonas sp. TaxID=2021466 RepID=UPI000B37106D|nr:DUF2752 domain-containing protein [Sellimonas sp.]OUP63738.1 hypothetical protein B5F13_09815 [Drancourtella sp. An177]
MHRKNSWKSWGRDTWHMIRKDLWNIRIVILVLAIYFTVAWCFLYTSCPLVLVTGFPCPGCGLSRAAFSILRGEFLQAWHLNPFIYAIVALAGAFCIRRYILHKETTSLKKWLLLLLIGMILFYIYRMIRYFPGEPPMSFYRDNLINRLLRAVGSV